jgi:hypothetical protein
MTLCHEMREGETYQCGVCGLEIRVVRSCTSEEEYDGGSGACSCTEPLSCCGQPLVKVS